MMINWSVIFWTKGKKEGWNYIEIANSRMFFEFQYSFALNQSEQVYMDLSLL